MKEYEKEFYAYIGLLSVKFSKMEYNLSVILGKLLGTNDDSITVTLIEKNTLSQNIELLKKINKIRNYQETAIKNIIEKIGGIKSDRNLFIHGIWGTPCESENDIMIVCDERKIQYTENKDNNGNIIGQKWAFNKKNVFRLTYIKKQIQRIEDILVSQEYLINELKTETFL